jgi:hypothetical protein
MPFSFLALAPKRVRLFFGTWMLSAIVIRVAFGFAEFKGLIIFPSHGEASIYLATFIFAFIRYVKSPSSDDED